MQLARAEVLDDCALTLYPGLPLFTVGGFNSSSSKHIITLQNTFKKHNMCLELHKSKQK